MKKELIAMRSPVYTKTGTSVPPHNEFSASSQHPLELFAEDRNTITNTFLRHLAHCRLSQRRFQIVLAIFNQTLGFNKFEDDMNGTRLQQLTGLLPNHANATVRELAQLNVLVIRKGHYGHYLAVNFNFSQWGQQHSDEQATIDPCSLLPDDEMESDETETLLETDFDDEDVMVEPDVQATTPPSLTITQAVTNDQLLDKETPKSAQPLHNQPVISIEELHTLLQPIVDRLDEMSKKIEQLDNAIKTRKDTPTVPQQPTEQPQQTITPPTAKPVQQAIQTQTPATTIAHLKCPPTLSPQKHQEARHLAAKAGDKAQLILDMLNQRMQNISDPLLNPIAYLDSLVKKLRAGRLTLPTTFASTQATAPLQPAKPSIAESCEAEYREARADRLQMENNIKRLAENGQTSFSDTLVQMGLSDLWESVKTRFSQAKAELEALQGEGQVVVV